MGRTGGWNIWGKAGERIRQFTVAIVQEQDAAARLRVENPDIEVLFQHEVDVSTISALGMSLGNITEWVPLDCKERLT